MNPDEDKTWITTGSTSSGASIYPTYITRTTTTSPAGPTAHPSYATRDEVTALKAELAKSQARVTAMEAKVYHHEYMQSQVQDKIQELLVLVKELEITVSEQRGEHESELIVGLREQIGLLSEDNTRLTSENAILHDLYRAIASESAASVDATNKAFVIAKTRLNQLRS